MMRSSHINYTKLDLKMEIKIVRLKTGEDLVGYYEDIRMGKLIIDNPMKLEFHTDYKSGKQILTMCQWLPDNVCKSNHVELNSHDVLAVLEPTEDFSEYYLTSIREFEDRKRAIKQLDEMRSDNDFALMEEAIREAEVMRDLKLIQ
jgi:hypothetical protein